MTQFHEFPVPHVYRLQLFWKNSGNNVGSSRTFWDYGSGFVTAGNLTVVCNSAISSWTNHMQAITHTNVTLDRVVCTDLDNANGVQSIVVAAAAGTAAGTELPVNNAAIANYAIATRYRGGKPKSFLIVGTAANTANGKQWSSAFQATLQAAWSGFLADMKSPGIAFPINQTSVSYYSGHQPDPTPTTWGPVNVPKPRDTPATHPVTGMNIALGIGSQRRRLKHEA